MFHLTSEWRNSSLVKHFENSTNLLIPSTTQCKTVAYRGGGFGVFNPPPEILKALQNRAKLNLIVKTVKNC